MPFTDAVTHLLSTCQTELHRMIESFESAPASAGLFDISAVAEIVALSIGSPKIEPVCRMVSDSAARFLRSGILEDLCVSRVELLYPTALLSFLAQRGSGYHRRDMAVLRRLCEGHLIGRSEVPVLTQQLITAYFTRCGIETDFGEPGSRDLAKMIDKRVLRARSDEYDLSVLLMCAQLVRLEEIPQRQRPALYPRTMLAQAIRSANANWLPVLAFVCSTYFCLDLGLEEAALESIRHEIPEAGDLVAPPRSTGLDSEYIGRAQRGLRIRSTLALILSLCTLGDGHEPYRTSLAVA